MTGKLLPVLVYVTNVGSTARVSCRSRLKILLKPEIDEDKICIVKAVYREKCLMLVCLNGLMRWEL